MSNLKVYGLVIYRMIQRQFTIDSLTSLIKRDNATLIGVYPKITKHISISFICNCGTSHKKLMESLVDGVGVFCKECSNAITSKKITTSYALIRDERAKRINLERYGVETPPVITSDTCCPNCKKDGYTSSNKLDTLNECRSCKQKICKLCAIRFNEKQHSYTCSRCSHLIEKTTIIRKISTYIDKDVKRFGRKGNVSFEDIDELLKRQDCKCYVCDDMLLTKHFMSRCLYQLSIDRIDNNKPHDRDNVLLSCYKCNCSDWFQGFDDNYYNSQFKYKLCPLKCHLEKRNESINRVQVPKEKINSLILSSTGII